MSADRSTLSLAFTGRARPVGSTGGIQSILTTPELLNSVLPTDRSISPAAAQSQLWGGKVAYCRATGSGGSQRMRLVRGELVIDGPQVMYGLTEGTAIQALNVQALAEHVLIWGLPVGVAEPTAYPTAANGLLLAQLTRGSQLFDVEVPSNIDGIFVSYHWSGQIIGEALTTFSDGTFYIGGASVHLAFATAQ